MFIIVGPNYEVIKVRTKYYNEAYEVAMNYWNGESFSIYREEEVKILEYDYDPGEIL